MHSESHATFPVILAFFGAATLIGCATTRPGPKLVEADGTAYTACGGALWFEDTREPKDNEPPTYEVIYTDAHGVKHRLTRVRTLKITELSDNTPDCLNSE